MINYNDIIAYNKLRRNGSYPINIEYEKILKARYNKNERIKQHIVYGLTHYKRAYFATFTFNDTFINKCDRTQRDAIKSPLKSFCIDYILNVDYGTQTERKHYHAILFLNDDLEKITTKEKHYNKKQKRYIDLLVNLPGYNAGFSSFEPIGNTKEDIQRLKKYINKLSNHCTKDTTANRIVFSFKAYDDLFLMPTNVKMTKKEYKATLHHVKMINKLHYFEDSKKLGLYQICQ